MKVSKLYIENYKMFKNFEMNFMDKDKKPLPIIVIAGINGSGKTTLLNYILKGSYVGFNPTYRNNNNIEFIENSEKLILNNEAKKERKEIEYNKNEQLKKTGNATIHYSNKGLFLDDLNHYIVYIEAIDNDTRDIKKNILEYYRQKSREYDSHSKALEHIQLFIKDSFSGLDLTFNIDDINDVVRDSEEVSFKNSNGDTFLIEGLSTGEKTLLSKILNLYFRHIENKIILIDEPELSLHPSWQNRVLKLYENIAIKNNCQIIMATHSPHIIGSAKNKYIKILRMNENNEVEVINDILAYGRDIEWILEDVMDTKSTREESISKKIKECQELLNDDKYNEAEICIDNLEKVIGKNDSEILTMRNDIAFWRN